MEPTCLPATRRAAPRCSTPAGLEASCAPTSFCSMAARVRAAAPPPPPARPPPPALPLRPVPVAGAAPPAWAVPTPPSRWCSCPTGETPESHARGARPRGWTAGQMHLLTSPVRTPPHGSAPSPHEGTGPTPPRRPKLTSLSPARPGDQLNTPAPHFLHSSALSLLARVGTPQPPQPLLLGAGMCRLAPPWGGGKTQSCLRWTIPRREHTPRLAPGATPRQRRG